MTSAPHHILLPFVAGLLGGICGVILMNTPMAQAAGSYLSNFIVYSPAGKKGVQTFVQDGQPGQFFFGEDGNTRIQIGTYNAPGERGQPLIGMSDNTGHIRMLYRLAGPYASPVIIMKDIEGRDRLVMGLDLQGSGNPFLSLVDQDGKKHNIFGEF